MANAFTAKAKKRSKVTNAFTAKARKKSTIRSNTSNPFTQRATKSPLQIELEKTEVGIVQAQEELNAAVKSEHKAWTLFQTVDKEGKRGTDRYDARYVAWKKAMQAVDRRTAALHGWLGRKHTLEHRINHPEITANTGGPKNAKRGRKRKSR